MGLISRVSSRTYRIFLTILKKMADHKRTVEMKNSVALVSTTGQPLSFNLVSTKKATKVDHDHLLNLANQISSADSHIKAGTTGKLKQIHDQIKKLQNEALQILENAKRDKMLHTAACNIVKKPGQIYYLYEKTSRGNNGEIRTELDSAKTEINTEEQNSEQYFSIMSPSDWGSSCPHKFLGAYRLGYDLAFMPLDEVDSHKEQDQAIEKVYNSFMSGANNSLEWKI